MKQLKILFLSLATMACADGAYSQAGLESSHFFIHLEMGGSFAQKADISVSPVWDASPDGYNAGLGSSFLSGFGIGYHLNDLWSSEISFVHRGGYSYSKHQNSSSTSTDKVQNPVLTSLNKTRYFELMNDSLMLSLYRKFPHHRMQWGGKSVVPVAGFGIGRSSFELWNFHSTIDGSDGIYSAMLPEHSNSMAWQMTL